MFNQAPSKKINTKLDKDVQFDERVIDTSRNEKLVLKEMDSMVKDIWKKYDRDQNGVLDKDELRSFVFDVLNNISLEQASMTKLSE